MSPVFAGRFFTNSATWEAWLNEALVGNAEYVIFCSSPWFRSGLSPVGPESQVRYSMINTPTITNDYISLDINVSASSSAQSWGLVASRVLGILQDS